MHMHTKCARSTCHRSTKVDAFGFRCLPCRTFRLRLSFYLLCSEVRKGHIWQTKGMTHACGGVVCLNCSNRRGRGFLAHDPCIAESSGLHGRCFAGVQFEACSAILRVSVGIVSGIESAARTEQQGRSQRPQKGGLVMRGDVVMGCDVICDM